MHIKELIELLRTGILSAVEERSGYIGAIDKTARGELPVSGLSFELYPWHQYLALSMRTTSELSMIDRYNPAEWKHFEFVRSDRCNSPEFRNAAQVVSNYYEDESGEVCGKEFAHLMFTAAAHALLDPAVAELLRKFGVRAPTVIDEPVGSAFEYMVFDPDGTLKSNYCDIELATRYTARILATMPN
jgi:hypothetical protein